MKSRPWGKPFIHQDSGRARVARVYTTWMSSQHIKKPAPIFSSAVLFENDINLHREGPTGYCGASKNNAASPQDSFSSVWKETHLVISNNYSNMTVCVYCGGVPPLLSSTTNYWSGVERAALWATCPLFIVTPRGLCPLPKNFQHLSLNHCALVVRGCIAKTTPHAWRHTYFTNKQHIDEGNPTAFATFACKKKKQSEVSLTTLTCTQGFGTAGKYAADVLCSKGQSAIERNHQLQT